MDLLAQLRLHSQALDNAVSANPKFFASVIHYVRRLKDLTTGLDDQLTPEELTIIADRIEDFWGKWRPSGGASLYIPPRETADTDSTVHHIRTLIDQITSLDAEDFAALSRSAGAALADHANVSPQAVTPCIFIGHGRSKLWARVKVFLEDENALATVAYESESRTGKAIVSVLEKMLRQATFAVIVLTAEDGTADGRARARQNVVHEAGLFQGRLGFSRSFFCFNVERKSSPTSPVYSTYLFQRTE